MRPFSDNGKLTLSGPEPVGSGEALRNFAHNPGIGGAALRDIIAFSIDCTQDYHHRVAELHLLPGANKRSLIAVTRKMASLMEASV